LEDSGLGTAPVSKLLLSASLNASIALLLYSIYSVTDSLFLAWSVDAYAAGAVSVTTPLLLILSAVSTMAGSGGASVISRCLGRGDQEQAARVAANVFLTFWLFAIIVSITGILLIDPLLNILGAAGRLYDYAKEYGVILLAGAVFSTGFSAIIRAEGAARFSMYIWVFPVLLNIVLDYLFLFPFQLGVKGAAAATVISQMLSLGMSIWFFFIRKKRTYYIKRQHFRLKRQIMKETVLIGFPSLVQQSTSSILLIIVNRQLFHYGGEAAVTAFGFVTRLQTLLLLPQSGIIQGMLPIFGYNMAGGKRERGKETIKLAAVGMIVYGIVAAGIGILFRKPLLTLFTREEEILIIGIPAMIFLLAAAPIKGYEALIASGYQALGNARRALVLTVVSFCGIKIPAILLSGSLWRLNGILWAFPVSDLLIFILAVIAGRKILDRSKAMPDNKLC